MGPAHLDGYLSEGTYRSFSSITDDTDDREPGSLKLWYAVDVKCIGLGSHIVFQQVLLGNVILEKHHSKAPSPIGRVHQNDDLARSLFGCCDFDRIDLSLNCPNRAVVLFSQLNIGLVSLRRFFPEQLRIGSCTTKKLQIAYMAFVDLSAISNTVLFRDRTTTA